jgi:hypothetical protein
MHNFNTANTSESPDEQLHIWVSPPNTPIPLTKQPIRIAVGTPKGVSSNSWRIWAKGMDTYVSCRDNFKEFKVSLHASGIWRVAFTKQAIKSRPDLFNKSNGDRVISRRTPDLTDSTKAVIGFQIVVLERSLYLQPSQRTKWPKSVAFVEPPVKDKEITVLSIVVAPTTETLTMPVAVRGSVIGKIPLCADRTVQLVATHESDENIKPLIKDAYGKISNVRPANLPEGAVFFVWGNRLDGTPWASAIQNEDIDSI